MKTKDKFKESLAFFKKFMVIAISTSLTITISACQSTLDQKTFSSSKSYISKEEETILVAVIPWQNSQKQEEKLKLLADYLQQETGKKFKFQITKDYQTAVDLLVENKVQIAYLAAFSYVQAKKRNPDLKAIVAPISQETGRPWYTSIIVANTNKGIKSIEDLKGKRLGLVSPNSTSGYLLPMAQFQTMGIVPEKYFAMIHYCGSHNQAQSYLARELVDAIANDNLSFHGSKELGQLSDAKYQVIWESKPIPNPPIVVSSKLSPILIDEIKQSLITAPKGLVDVTGSESAGYTLVEDSDYDGIRNLKAQIKSYTQSK